MSSDRNVAGSSVTLHVVSSLDGFIARKDNNVSWLEANGSVYEAGVSISAEEIARFIQSIDCYVLGSRTYEHALELGRSQLLELNEALRDANGKIERTAFRDFTIWPN